MVGGYSQYQEPLNTPGLKPTYMRHFTRALNEALQVDDPDELEPEAAPEKAKESAEEAEQLGPEHLDRAEKASLEQQYFAK